MANFHITITVRGRRTLAPTETLRRALVRVVARVLGASLLLFSLVDEHLHVVLRCARPRLVAARLRLAVAAVVPDLTLEAPHVKAVDSRAHLLSLVGYLLTQTDHHGLRVPSALWSGSCFLDLMNARVVPGYDARSLREELPRLGKRDLLARVGLSAQPLLPASDDDLARVGVARLLDLATAVLAIGPVITAARSHERPVVAARALVARAARLTGASTATIARSLSIDPRAVRRLGARDLDPRLLLALRLRLALEERVAGSAVRAG